MPFLLDTVTPLLSPVEFFVTYDANGGLFPSLNVEQYAEKQIKDMGYKLPLNGTEEPIRHGWKFEGWWTEQTGGVQITEATRVTATRDQTLYAHWQWLGATITVTFNANGGERVVPGTKEYTPGLTFGQFPVPTRLGYKFEGWWTMADGGTRMTEATAVPDANVELFAHWTLIVTPEPTPTPAPESVFAGTLDVAFAKVQTVDGTLYKGDALAGTVQVKVGKISKKGVVKVSATVSLLVDGKVKKVTAKAVNVNVGETTGSTDALKRVPPVTIAFKAPIGEMTFEMEADGTFTLKNSSYLMAEARIGGALKSGTSGTFSMDGSDLAVPGELQDDLLPNEESFSVSGGKWAFAKATTVKWAKDRVTKEYGLVVDDTKGKTNLSGLKLTYTAKTGLFKGSFKAYALETKNGKTKLVKYTVNVIGFVVDGVGYGEASCKKPAGGSWPVTVE